MRIPGSTVNLRSERDLSGEIRPVSFPISERLKSLSTAGPSRRPHCRRCRSCKWRLRPQVLRRCSQIPAVDQHGPTESLCRNCAISLQSRHPEICNLQVNGDLLKSGKLKPKTGHHRANGFCFADTCGKSWQPPAAPRTRAKALEQPAPCFLSSFLCCEPDKPSRQPCYRGSRAPLVSGLALFANSVYERSYRWRRP